MKKKDNNVYFDLFAQFEELKNNEKLISNNKLISTVLLNANLGFDSLEYKEFVSNLAKAKENRWYIKFDNFVIDFAQNQRFGALALLPVISKDDDSTYETLNLSSSAESKFLTTLNKEINTLLAENLPIEIVEDLILFNSEISNELKLFFSKEWISYLRIENGIR